MISGAGVSMALARRCGRPFRSTAIPGPSGAGGASGVRRTREVRAARTREAAARSAASAGGAVSPPGADTSDRAPARLTLPETRRREPVAALGGEERTWARAAVQVSTLRISARHERTLSPPAWRSDTGTQKGRFTSIAHIPGKSAPLCCPVSQRNSQSSVGKCQDTRCLRRSRRRSPHARPVTTSARLIRTLRARFCLM